MAAALYRMFVKLIICSSVMMIFGALFLVRLVIYSEKQGQSQQFIAAYFTRSKQLLLKVRSYTSFAAGDLSNKHLRSYQQTSSTKEKEVMIGAMGSHFVTIRTGTVFFGQARAEDGRGDQSVVVKQLVNESLPSESQVETKGQKVTSLDASLVVLEAAAITNTDQLKGAAVTNAIDNNGTKIRQHNISSRFIPENVQFADEQPPFQMDNNAPEKTPEPTTNVFSPPELSDVHKQRLELLTDRCVQQQSRSYHANFNSTNDVITDHLWNGLSPSERRAYALVDQIGDQLFVNDRLKFIYCLVPKVACTTWSRVLLVAAGAHPDRQPNQLPQSEVNTERLFGTALVRLNEYSPREIEYRLKYYFKFMFVRHPFERLVSAYKDRLKSNHQLPRNIFGKRIVGRYRQADNDGRKKKRRGPKPKVPTFDEFIQYLIDPDTMDVDGPFNPHWRPQHDLCLPCLLQYDFVGHLETLTTDAKFVLESLGVAFTESGNRNVTRTSGIQFPETDPDNAGHVRSADAVDRLFSMVPSSRRQKLAEIYRLDFELFGYDNSTLRINTR